jgi:hypothetical protein
MRRVLVLCAVVLSCATSMRAQTAVCESINNQYRECRVGISGRIRILMEISPNLCAEGITWGWNMLGVVWVTRGCRATFTIDNPDSQQHRAKNHIVCESVNDKRQVCPAEGDKGAAVILVQQLSKTPCLRGKNWGSEPERNLIWVDRGCRGEFIVGPTTEGLPETAPLDFAVLCESENGKRKHCKADTTAGVQIVRQLSNNACGYGREWGYDANGIWVNKGCRAEFVVRGKPKVMVSSLVCESEIDSRKVCPADTRYGVALFRELGGKECIFEKSWGFDEKGVWVAGGCHAQFALGGYRLPSETMPPNAEKLTCESLDGGHKPCPVDTSHGVGLLRQISDADCVLNRTWGYDRNGIWVTDGCRAEFAVAH